jgi:hypothetical protein
VPELLPEPELEPEPEPEGAEEPEATSTTDVVVVEQSPSVVSSSLVEPPVMQVPFKLPVRSALLHPHEPVQSAPHLIPMQGSMVLVLVVLVVDVVGQSPRVISSSFVVAPAMQVPSLPPVLSALLHPHAPVQSAPHLILSQG